MRTRQQENTEAMTNENDTVEKEIQQNENETVVKEIQHNDVGEWGWGVEGKQVGSMDEESQVRGCYNITLICTPTNQETVSVGKDTSKQNI